MTQGIGRFDDIPALVIGKSAGFISGENAVKYLGALLYLLENLISSTDNVDRHSALNLKIIK
jgi:hypothetical protein